MSDCTIPPTQPSNPHFTKIPNTSARTETQSNPHSEATQTNSLTTRIVNTPIELEDAFFTINGEKINFKIHQDKHGQKYINMQQFRQKTGLVLQDEGLMSTAVFLSSISRVDGHAGKLWYQDKPIEDLISNSDFLEIANLLFYGSLNSSDHNLFSSVEVINGMNLSQETQLFFCNKAQTAQPLSILSSMIGTLGLEYKNANTRETAQNILSIMPVCVAFILRRKCNLEWTPNVPRKSAYTKAFLGMLFPEAMRNNLITASVITTLDSIFLLHADHGMNASTFTLRAAASSTNTNPFDLIQAALASLSGPSHGGANKAVIEMLNKIQSAYGSDCSKFIQAVISKKETLMGFGHRVYKNYDPRARQLKRLYTELNKELGTQKHPLFTLAEDLEEKALNADYFQDRNLYPNLDFYSGLIFLRLFEAFSPNKSPEAEANYIGSLTLFFALGRTAGWLAHWKEIVDQAKTKNLKIVRPRLLAPSQTQITLPLEARKAKAPSSHGFFFNKPEELSKL